MDVIGVGDIDIDIYLEVEHIPTHDEKVLAKNVSLFPGGMVANFLVALRRLGTSCGFHGPVGLDEYGQLAINDLKNNLVDTSHVIYKENGRTYFCIVILDDSGEKALIVAPTDCLAPNEEDISPSAIGSAKHMHTVFHSSAQLKAIELARKNNLSISVDFEPDSVKLGKNINEILSLIDVAFINQNALFLMSKNKSIEKAMDDILVRGPRVVCVTLGKRGAIITTQATKKPIYVESFHVPVIDTTGAGDCFAAGFIHGYLQNWPMDFVGKFSSATAAIKIMKKGGHTGAPTYDQVIQFLDEKNVYIPDFKFRR